MGLMALNYQLDPSIRVLGLLMSLIQWLDSPQQTTKPLDTILKGTVNNAQYIVLLLSQALSSCVPMSVSQGTCYRGRKFQNGYRATNSNKHRGQADHLNYVHGGCRALCAQLLEVMALPHPKPLLLWEATGVLPANSSDFFRAFTNSLGKSPNFQLLPINSNF